MKRNEIIEAIGKEFITSNLEADEFSYKKALSEVGKNIEDYYNNNEARKYQKLDLRFANDRLTILIETKAKFTKKDMRLYQEQLSAYVRYEKEYSENKIVAILAETNGDEIYVWYGGSVIIDDNNKAENEMKIKDFSYYENLYFSKTNNKTEVIKSTKRLNEILHNCGIREKLRSQFVGTCLLALKNGLMYENVKEKINSNGNKNSKEKVIINNLRESLSGLLAKDSDPLNKVEKLAILNREVLEDQHISELSYTELQVILRFIDKNILPYINDKIQQGRIC